MTATAYREEVGSRWAQRWIAGLFALLLGLGAVGGSWAPKANAQGGIGEAIVAATTANELCKLVYGEGGGLADCLDNIVDSGLEAADLARCIGDDLTGDDAGEDTGTGDGGDGGDGGEGQDENAQARSSFEECLKKLTEDEDEEPNQEKQDDYSLYRMSSSLAAFYSNNMVPGGGSDSDSGSDSGSDEDNDSSDAEPNATLKDWSSVIGTGKAGTAGAFLANPNQDFLENENWIFSYGDANNDAVFRYDTFDRSGELDDPLSDLGSSPDEGIGEYAYYGATLSGLGFDSTSARDSMSTAKNSVMGTGILIAYVAAGAVDTVFDTVVSLLQTLNPFRLITDWATSNTRNAEGFREGYDPNFTAGMPGEAEGTNGAFDGLKDFLGTMYTGFVNLGWLVTIPIFIGVFFFGVLMSRRYMPGDGFKKLAIRIGFLTVGVPLLGVSYTGALESLQGASGEAGTANASKIVASTYVDFEKWTDGRLTPPKEATGGDVTIGWDTENNRPTDESQAKARDLALAVNSQSNPAFAGFMDGAEGDEHWVGNVTGRDQTDSSPTETYTATLNMLNRYISGERVSSAAYESAVKGALTKLGDKSDDPSGVLSWVRDFNNVSSIEGMSKSDVDNMNNPLLQVSNDSGIKSTSGFNENGGKSFEFTRGSYTVNSLECTPDLVAHKGWNGNVGDDSALSYCAMSPLAMYNYLNTDFGSTSGTLFSPTASNSAWTRVQHSSVNAIGSGMMAYLYWFSAMTLLTSFALIGFIYGLALMINSIKRGIQLIAAIPFAMIGLLPGIAKTIVYTIVMFLEIFMTLFVYKVVQEFMMVIPGLIEKPLVDNLSSINGDAAVGIGGAVMGGLMLGVKNPTTVVMIVTAVASIGVILFTVMAVKLRSTLTQAMDEGVTSIINKVIGTGVSGGQDPNSGSGLRQGVARGASMAATHQIISGGSGGGGTADADGDGDTGGPDEGPGGAAAGGVGGAAMAGGLGADGDEADGMTEASYDEVGGELEGPAPDAEGTMLPAGDYDVDADGNITNADGNAMVDADGNPVGLNDVANIDAEGNITDAEGNPMIGQDGQPINASDVGGIDKHGNLTDSDGAPLLDQTGMPVKADGAQNVDTLGGAGDQVNQAASAESDQAVADQVEAQGGLSADGAVPAMVGAGVGAAAMSGGNGPTNVGGTNGGGDTGGVGGAINQVAQNVGSNENASPGAQAIGQAVSGTTGASMGGAPVVPQQMSLSQGTAHLRDQAMQAGRDSGVYQRFGGAQQVPQAQAPAAPAAQPAQQVSNNVPTGGGNDGPGFGRYLAAGAVGAGVNRVAGGGQTRTQRTISESINGGRGGRGAAGQQGKPGTQGAQQGMRSARRGRGGVGGAGMSMATGMMMGQRGQGQGGTGNGGQQGQQGAQSPQGTNPRVNPNDPRNQWGTNPGDGMST